jgi:conjugative transfer region protein TrbK
MLDRSEIFRGAAIIAVLGVFVASVLGASRRAPVSPETSPVLGPATDALSAELRRCSALGPQDAEDPHCVAVWEENRQRFFGRPARPRPSGTAAPASSSSGDAP